jgi:hypothetical protein
MLIRRANTSDAEELAILAERTFRKTFQDGNTQEDMELHCQASYSTHIQLKEILRQDWVTLVCEYESKLIGYAQLRWEEFPHVSIVFAPGKSCVCMSMLPIMVEDLRKNL